MTRRDVNQKRALVRSGLGALCAEAQADGIPCTELGKDCDVCERARVADRDRDPD
jgi:hypothetical protein